jgi:mobilization protein NikA
MARPRQGEVRDRHVAFRLTLEETLALRERTARAGKSLSDYARHAALAYRPHSGGRCEAIHPFAMEPATFHEIRRLGVNLNQIARRLNAQDMPAPPELGPLLAEIHAALRKALLRYGA